MKAGSKPVPQSEAPVTTHLQSHAEAEPGRNVFLDKISARFITAAETLAAAAASLDGRDHVTPEQLYNLRWAAGDALRSLDMIGAIATHFESDLLTPGGLPTQVIAAQVETATIAQIQAALAGEVRA